jgi:hypothetical protein
MKLTQKLMFRKNTKIDRSFKKRLIDDGKIPELIHMYRKQTPKLIAPLRNYKTDQP